MFFCLFITVDLLCSGVLAFVAMKTEEVNPPMEDVQFGNIYLVAWWFDQANLIIDSIYLRYGQRSAVIMTWLLATIYLAPFVAIVIFISLAVIHASSAADYGA